MRKQKLISFFDFIKKKSKITFELKSPVSSCFMFHQCFITICLLDSGGERWLCHADVFEQLLIVFEQMPINLSALSDEQRRLRLKKREVKKTKAEATIRYDDDFTADNYRHLWKWSSRWFATDTSSVSPVLEEEAADQLTDLYNCVLPSYNVETSSVPTEVKCTSLKLFLHNRPQLSWNKVTFSQMSFETVSWNYCAWPTMPEKCIYEHICTYV